MNEVHDGEGEGLLTMASGTPPMTRRGYVKGRLRGTRDEVGDSKVEVAAKARALTARPARTTEKAFPDGKANRR